MREILFRGREKGGSKWFEGDMSYLVHDKRKCYIFPPDGYDSPDRYEVDPTTVGQYTDLTDRNGVKIFEGDIVFYENTGIIFEVRYNFSEFLLVDKARLFHDIPLIIDDYFEVIGNIYDNPELMEDKQC